MDLGSQSQRTPRAPGGSETSRFSGVLCCDECGQNNSNVRLPTDKLDGPHHHPVAQPRLVGRRSSPSQPLLKFASAAKWRSSTLNFR